MKHTKQLLAVGVLTASVVGGGAFALSASAQSSHSNDSLAGKIAQKFNLNEDEVKQAISEHRQEHRAEHIDNKLTKAVEDGKLTEDQKTKVKEYLEANKPNFDELKDQTHEERHDSMEKFREEFNKWAQGNDIDPDVLMLDINKGHHRFGEKGME